MVVVVDVVVVVEVALGGTEGSVASDGTEVVVVVELGAGGTIVVVVEVVLVGVSIDSVPGAGAQSCASTT